MSEQERWSGEVWGVLRQAGVRQVAHVPDAGHAGLIRRAEADADVTAIPLTTEEEGIGVLAGAWLGGDRGVLLMQSSGVGNCVNMLSLTRVCRFPLLMLVTMRGEWGEANGWQIPMGGITRRVLELAEVQVLRAERPEDAAAAVRAGAAMAFEGGAAVAVLLSQRLIGAKEFSR
jgi:sulfopyruvate decarboxylase alpha subunit